eukprot:9294202-Ditylum_brightwellii.AAC.1
METSNLCPGDWDYEKRRVDLAMLGYISKAQMKYGHKDPKRQQHSPHKHAPIKYVAKTQLVEEDLMAPLNKMRIKQ